MSLPMVRFFERGDVLLALAPHTDDIDLGAGGLIQRAIAAGVTVHEVAFSIARESVPPGFPGDVLEHEVRHAAAMLGLAPENVSTRDFAVRHFPAHRQELLEELIVLRKRLSPSVVLVPASTDLHQDHQTVTQEAIRAFKGTTLLGYELPWNNLSFSPTAVIGVSDEHMSQKVKALECYRSQAHRPYATEEVVRAIARMRGATIGVRYAEAFEVLRFVA